MYSKDQVSQLRQSFWTTFGQYIAPQPSAAGDKINWINYKTGIRHLHFKMEAGQKSAFIAIELTHPDAGIQALLYEQFVAFRTILGGYLGEDWKWQFQVKDEHNKAVSRIIRTLPGVSVYKQEDWPALISFFKPRMIALDEFWSDVQDSFTLFR